MPPAPPVPAPQVAVVLVNWNSWRDTVRCLDALEATTYPAYRVLVVDNHSRDDSRAQLAAYTSHNPRAGARIQVLHHTDNAGYAGGVNVAVAHAFGGENAAPDFVFLLNNDARAEPSALARCVDVATAHDAALVGGLVLSEGGDEVLFAGGKFPRALFLNARPLPMGGRGRRCWEADWADGAAMLIRADLVKRRLSELGYLLDPDLFMYGEEIELSWWARRHGYRVLMAGQAAVYHRVGGSGGLPLSLYYITRNRVLLARRLLPWRLRVAFHCWYPVSRVVRIFQNYLAGKDRLARVTLCGLVDGYRSVVGRWKLHPQ